MMSIIYTSFPFPTSISLSTIKLVTKDISLRPYILLARRQKFSRKRDLALQTVASFSFPPIDVDCLASEFCIDGVTFSGISDSCVIRMALENGSMANVMLPSGLITSFKVPMWHGGTMELLHTTVSEGENSGAVIRGGISLAFNCQNDRGSWSPNIWALHQVKGTPQESIQVELISRNSEGNVEVRHVINLQQNVLISEILVSNASASALRLMGSLISHLTVSTPEATYAVGLEGSDFFRRPPVLANFSIIPPDFGNRNDQVSEKLWGHIALNKLILRQNTDDDLKSTRRNIEEERKGEEKDNQKHLTDKMSRIYTSAPRNFTVIDRVNKF
ncbi:NDH-DEPENDENT CYCLIC ELECTRON FLOW 5 [Olea europaea subsp. europaea]|uniref:NDH-DEPENDENT CYCLIC ELECTRON FLOW 5 n=1 Tax=Olea europaea subsp. europaea TaxID=158383 RepID=A0A8S0U8F3_OLEEU|nr:NDH-DEPENDENT CYCLIC ELECTRON FLOW 5 [Olea europaea subsp. europaea]